MATGGSGSKRRADGASPPPGGWGRLLLLPACALALLVLPFEVGDLDLVLSRPFVRGDPARFPLKSHWLFHEVAHTDARLAVIAVTSALFLVALASRRLPRLRPWAGAALYLVLCVALSTGLVQLLKPWTNRYSPWSFQEFGGPVPFTPLIDGTPEPFRGGRSFPAAHAIAGFAWLGLFHVARAAGIRRAWRWLAPGLALGWLFAWAQHVRGAHFLSHDLWSLLIAWVLTTLLAWLFTLRGWWGPLPAPAAWSRIEAWGFAAAGACAGVGLATVPLAWSELRAAQPPGAARGAALVLLAALAGGWVGARWARHRDAA